MRQGMLRIFYPHRPVFFLLVLAVSLALLPGQRAHSQDDAPGELTFPQFCGCFHENMSGVYPVTLDGCDEENFFTPGVVETEIMDAGSVDGLCIQFSNLVVGPYDERGLFGILGFDASDVIGSCSECAVGPAQAAAPDPLVIFIGGWTSHNSPDDPSLYLGFQDVRQAILDDPELNGRIGPEDFAYFSYANEYYVSPAGTVDHQIPIYDKFDTMDLSMWDPAVMSEKMGVLRYHLTLLIQQFPDRPIVLVAHSLGGVLATYWAATVHQDLADRVKLIVTLDSPLQGTHAVLADRALAAKITQVPHIASDHRVIRDLQAAVGHTRVFTVRHTRDVVVTAKQAALPGAWRDLAGDFGGNVKYRKLFSKAIANPDSLVLLALSGGALDEANKVHGVPLHEKSVLAAVTGAIAEVLAE